ncbi:MAG: phosphoglycerate mutase (2,3-diphosphoglycerate-independent) [Magnetovibrio sp.]|nr:phosphoglycerate mutase (2,3-diphosphoglycerate-independent) [Magnetovibrio sp.]|tara:strand:- start:874 stop:2454 length:1581 start_codon:yes stop_codon:yes gene_type:complete
MIDSSDKPYRPNPTVLCILDGWGEREEAENNAIALAPTPNWDKFISTYPKAKLKSCATDVGLPIGQMGNSEVGHMNLGAGRIVMQDLPRIDAAIKSGALARNPELLKFADKLKDSGGTCHLMGLLSPGGVHSHQNHLLELVRIITNYGVPVCLHAFLDGRDTPPRKSYDYLARIIKDTAGLKKFNFGVISGRYWAMDRDERWDRIEKAYSALANATGLRADDPLAAIKTNHEKDIGDEFIKPTVIGDYAGMSENDGLLMANFRADRAREILTALTKSQFDKFKRTNKPKFAAYLGMVDYSNELSLLFPALFPAESLSQILGEVISEAGYTQLRIAETEKYAHITFFFNGGEEDPFKGEERILIPSPKVKTYDLQPQMSAVEVTEKLVSAIMSRNIDFIVVNYANGDMVGHTGILAAAIDAVTTIDTCLGQLETAIRAVGGSILLTADHGNCEEMVDSTTGEPHTQHTLNPVPAILINPPSGVLALDDGRLCDIAPTLLELMGIDKPIVMTGKSLLRTSGKKAAKGK